ncbi:MULTISPECIES: DUF2550 family protein [unclassified Actinomyces]|uniref:DUF2550 family protein n=1 Tax=unclassified Actinomyces TaxID=2609248 RepID=UPI0013742E6D|nr:MULTISPECIES: DUF2550 family protein [unclassified Actinomyces]MBW3068781.1 DUF2550 family protein [Actinomyces sp. 594]NDR54505.1 DUF2550 family protein [Actinomyces sp. 565]QHO91516.1 DUF2550 domain-containing protein [Actinomyces sp. 432]
MPVWEVVVAVALVVIALTGGFLLRLRFLAGRVGSFECALRPQGSARWISGIAVFGDDDLEWHRLVSFGLRRRRRFRRDDLELGPVHHRGQGGHVVDVPCKYRGERFELAMVEDSHSALVAWIESAAPSQPTLF